MKNKKFLLFALAAALLAGAVALYSCNGESTPHNEGLKAGLEMCACVASFEAPDPAVITDSAAFHNAFMAYAGKLSGCLGVIAKYEKYVTANMDGYDETSDEPLLSVFDFKDEGFKEGFAEGVASCSDTFTALFALMGQGQ